MIHIRRPIPELERVRLLETLQHLPILQTPISHYINTLQSVLLQIVTYLYCRMHLALLHHTRGVRLRPHRAPWAGNLLAQMASNPPEMNNK